MIRKQRLCHDSLFKSMETKNVIELSAFSKSLSKKITYLNHEERIVLLFSNKNQFYLKCEAKEKWRLYVFARRMLQSKKKK